MRIGDAFPSSYIKVDDLQGRAVRCTISDYSVEKLGDDTKPVLRFRGKEKALALNRTNANAIADGYGEEMDDWIGKAIELFPAKTDYQGKRVDCIRVRLPAGVVPAPEPAPAEPDLEEPPF